MPKYSRLFISAALTALLTASLFVNTKPVRACPEDPPQTLLQNYMESDLAIVADVAGEKVLNQEDPNEWGYGALIKKDLRLVKLHKGNSPRALSFETWEFFNRTTNDDGTSNGNEERSYALLPGKRYLLFFKKDEKSGAYELLETPTASRELETANEALYDKRISELAAILKAGKDQLPRLTEWLVKLTEETATLYHGASDLSRSFYALSNGDAEEEEEDGGEKAAFHLTEYSQVSLPDIAESVTDSQKQRISSVLDRHFHDALAGVTGGDGTPIQIDYVLVGLVSNWDLRQLTIGANALLMNSDPTDSNRVNVLMALIAYAVDDEELNSLWASYREVDEGEGSADEAEAAVPENAEAQALGSGAGENSAGPDNAANTDEAVTKAGEDAAAAKKVKLDQLMTAMVGKFSDRYQYLLAKDFTGDENDEEMETANEDPETPPGPQEIKDLPLIAPVGDPKPDGN